MVKIGKYNHEKIEAVWQKRWQDSRAFVVPDSGKDKFYGLVEFPYPSGEGLHTGHLRSYTALDVICRYQRLQGKNVLYPMGMDAFGLPAENYAVKKNIPPQETTKKNIANYIRQLTSTGCSFDWSRFLATTDPDYYHWTQWIFIQLWENGLAYKAKKNINWCPACQIGLANEEVINGHCERCGSQVTKKEKEQWLLKITKYADRLIEGLDGVDFLEQIKLQQKNWIGRSEGAEIDFVISDSQEKLKVFTTRPDTLFGVTFMVVAPEHPVIYKLEDKIKNLGEVKKYIVASRKKSDLERADLAREKTGIELKGWRAINPINQEKIPIFVADYVTMGYGTGAIMAVPAHDQRDWEFAKKYKLPIREVIVPLRIDKKNPPVKGKRSVIRRTVHALVFNPKNGQVLCLKWKQHPWTGFIVGGVDDEEDIVAAARREVYEETGYKDLKFVKSLDGQVRGEYFAAHKDENRIAYTTAVVFELSKDKPDDISPVEQAKHEPIWLDLKNITPENFTCAELDLWMERLQQTKNSVYSGDGVLINSGKYDGLDTKAGADAISRDIKAKQTVNYRLHDWIFSRQRYWGEPIPMVFCEKCDWQPIAEKDLPVVLPDIKDFKPGPDGQSPLSKVGAWVNTTCPKCGGPAKRETDTMPNWAGSNWYFIRYTDPKNKKQLSDPKKIKYWLPVDWYNGGMEHNTLHLLYSRFIFKFLYDIGVIPKEVGDEPYRKRTAQGMILGEGNVKMSKSRGNVVNPDDYVKKYGADTLRLYIMFMGPFDQAIAWDDKGVLGVHRFVNKIWNLQAKVVKNHESAPEVLQLFNQSIKKIGDDILSMHFNTAVSQLMILANFLDKQSAIDQGLWAKLLVLMSPFAPHLAEELWSFLGNKEGLSFAHWPEYDKNLVKKQMVTVAIQINGKLRDTIELPLDTADSQALQQQILQREKVLKAILNRPVKKFIYVKNKIISIVV
ncbi:MAG: class I tRNA ligase family protein [Patescibacteria group bacterium]